MSNNDDNSSNNAKNLSRVRLPPGAKVVPGGPFIAADSFNNAARMKAASAAPRALLTTTPQAKQATRQEVSPTVPPSSAVKK